MFHSHGMTQTVLNTQKLTRKRCQTHLQPQWNQGTCIFHGQCPFPWLAPQRPFPAEGRALHSVIGKKNAPHTCSTHKLPGKIWSKYPVLHAAYHSPPAQHLVLHDACAATGGQELPCPWLVQTLILDILPIFDIPTLEVLAHHYNAVPYHYQACSDDQS